MPVLLDTTGFNALIGPPPKLPEPTVILHTKPGTGGIGGRVQPAVGKECEIQLLDVVADSSRLTTQYGYRSLIGTIVDFTHKSVVYSTTYSVKFLVLGVEIVESRTAIRALGRNAAGTTIDYAPAGWIVSKWRLVAVPTS